MVNNIPVNGWPQLKDLEVVQPTLDRLDKIEAWKRTVKEETFTGDDITIENALALPARSLITEINAIQDLHGYDKPWVGGAYKNKLPNLYTSKSSAGINYDVYDNGAVHVHGTSTNISAFSLGTFNLNDNSYIINGCPSGGGSSTYELQAVTSDNITYRDYGSGASFPANETVTGQILVRNGITIDKVFYPMIRLASESDPTFAPYSNICPISGRDSVVLTRSDGDEISEDFTIQLGTTVYGAEINWDTGVMTVTDAFDTITASSSIGRDNYNNSFYVVHNDFKRLTSYTMDDIICDKLPTVTNQSVIRANGVGICGYGDSGYEGQNWVYFNADASITTIEAIKAWLTDNPMQVCYKLATPTTIQLTPEQLEMLKGYNHITLSDGYGTIELKALTGANWS